VTGPGRTASLAADIAADADPFSRARRISEVARAKGTLPTALSVLRQEALRELRTARHSARVIAEQVGITRSRVFQLTRPAAGQESS
jgi:hypothetical protein